MLQKLWEDGWRRSTPSHIYVEAEAEQCRCRPFVGQRKFHFTMMSERDGGNSGNVMEVYRLFKEFPSSSFRLLSTLRFCLYSTLIFKYKYSLRRFAIVDVTMEYWACCGVSISCWRGERTTRNPFHSLFAFCRHCWWEYQSCSMSDGMRRTEDNGNIFKINDKFTLHEFKVILLLSSCSSTSLSFILRRLTISLVYHISSSLSSCCCCCLFKKFYFISLAVCCWDF